MAMDIGLEFAANPGLLCAVRGTVRGYVEGFGFSKERVDEVVLAIDEACANSIRHAYGGPCDRSLRLSMSSTTGWVVFEVLDDGTPAPKDRLERKRELPEGPPDIENITPGGLGVQLIYGAFDDVQFSPGEDAGNHVVMKLKRPDEGNETQATTT